MSANHPNRGQARGADFRAWFRTHLSESARDIARHGADAGYPYITYTRDCVRVFDRFADEIWAMAVEQAEELGSRNVADMLAGFNRADMLADWDSFKTLLLWFACEQVAQEESGL